MKNIQELRDTLENAFAAGINFQLFLGVATARGLTYFRADLSEDSSTALCKNYVGSVRRFLGNENLSVMPLSEVDNRADIILAYDLPEKPQGIPILESLLEDAPAAIFSFDNHSVQDVKSIAIKISSATETALFYKKLYPVSVVKQNQIMIWRAGNRFEYVDGDLLKLSGGFDLLFLGGDIYISDLTRFETSFSFHDIAQRVQRKTAESIIALGIVDDLKSYLSDGHAPRRDMLRVAKSEVLQLPANEILSFATSMQMKLGLKIIDDRIQLTSKESVKKFVKLLNDDYLKSELTKNDYDSLAKNKMI